MRRASLSGTPRHACPPRGAGPACHHQLQLFVPWRRLALHARRRAAQRPAHPAPCPCQQRLDLPGPGPGGTRHYSAAGFSQPCRPGQRRPGRADAAVAGRHHLRACGVPHPHAAAAQSPAAAGLPDRAPVGCFPANGYGLWDAVGNVWEWTRDPWRPYHDPQASASRPANARTTARTTAQASAPTRVVKGGSFPCAQNFCVRYRPASRQPQETAMSTQHVGFRTVLNLEP